MTCLYLRLLVVDHPEEFKARLDRCVAGHRTRPYEIHWGDGGVVGANLSALGKPNGMVIYRVALYSLIVLAARMPVAIVTGVVAILV
ncbi:MAG: hypothetical protein NTU53_08950 [Planctomycetota bacterium]|nr:hypothetical protein [Planctomycetota bacterium]